MTMPTPDLDQQDVDNLRVALCQIQTEAWETESNFDRTILALKEAAQKGAELAITPECVFHGYGFLDDKQQLIERMREAAVTLDSEKVSIIQNLAQKNRMPIVLGIAEKTPENKIHNSALFINRTGEIESIYRKVHCREAESISENGSFTPGDTFVTTPIRAGKNEYTIGSMICFDREIPESVRTLRAMGSHLIACPLATMTDRLDLCPTKAENELLTRARAAENELFIVVVNHSGRYNGGSFVVGPSGEVMVQLGENPTVEVVDIPIGVIPNLFHNNPLGWAGWGYRRPEVYRPHL
jgi:predicted amidohydrolase